MEVQHDMAGAQCDVARSSCSLLGCFAAFGLEPRRVGAPTRHGGGQYDVTRSFCSLLGCFGLFGLEPRRVGGPTRHGALPMRRGALFLLPFGLFCRFLRRSHVVLEVQRDMAGSQYDVARSFCSLLGCFGPFWAGATSRWRPNATWRTSNATWRALLAPFRAVLPLFEAEPRRVGGPTRHGRLPIRRGALFLLPFGLFWTLWDGATSCWKPNATWRGPNTTWPSSNAAWQGAIQCDAPFFGHFNT